MAVRGGGHNVDGRALCDDSLVIDLSQMRGVLIDPATRTVRAQGGATLGDVDRETHLHGLAVPLGVISKTGIAALTLGGVVGRLVRKHRLSCDVTSLSDAAIDTLIEQAKGMTSPASGLLVECHGAKSRGAADGAGAFAQRESDYLVAMLPMWTDPNEDAAQIAWAKGAYDAPHPYSTGDTLLSYLSADEEEAVQTAFGKSYDRLRKLKKVFGPANFFNQNQNILHVL